MVKSLAFFSESYYKFFISEKFFCFGQILFNPFVRTSAVHRKKSFVPAVERSILTPII